MRPSSTPPVNHSEDRYRARLTGAILFSLLVHGLLLSMQFGMPGLGLPSLELPWRDRRVQAVDLQVVLADAARAPEAATSAASAPPAEAPPPSVPSTAANGTLKVYPSTIIAPPSSKEERATTRKAKRDQPARTPRKTPSRIKREKPVIALDEHRPDSFAVTTPSPDPGLPVAEVPEPEAALAEPAPVVDTAAEHRTEDERREREAQEAARREEEDRALEAAKRDETIRQEQLEAERETRELELNRQAEESARRAQELALQRERDQQLKRERDAAEQRALELEALQREQARLHEAARAEKEALELQARRQAEEAARQQATLALQQQREEALAREREETVRRAAELEAKRREDERRLEAARREQEAKELDARKQAEQAERQRQAALEGQRLADGLAARQRAEADMARQRERETEVARGLADGQRAPSAALPRDMPGGGLAGRAIEQARRSEIFRNDAPSRTPDAPVPETRRRSFLGSIAQDVGLMMYVESWKLKIERNGNLNYQPSSAERARGDPIVTVALRSDGSVESVTIERSSGRQELDEAVRRIVRLNARYSVFPPELARRFDVIEIRRVWNFDERLRILEEVR